MLVVLPEGHSHDAVILVEGIHLGHLLGSEVEIEDVNIFGDAGWGHRLGNGCGAVIQLERKTKFKNSNHIVGQKPV